MFGQPCFKKTMPELQSRSTQMRLRHYRKKIEFDQIEIFDFKVGNDTIHLTMTWW